MDAARKERPSQNSQEQRTQRIASLQNPRKTEFLSLGGTRFVASVPVLRQSQDSRPQFQNRDSLDVFMEGGNPLPPLFKQVSGKSVLRRIRLAEDLGHRCAMGAHDRLQRLIR
jgi:hypothetical protein